MIAQSVIMISQKKKKNSSPKAGPALEYHSIGCSRRPSSWLHRHGGPPKAHSRPGGHARSRQIKRYDLASNDGNGTTVEGPSLLQSVGRKKGGKEKSAFELFLLESFLYLLVFFFSRPALSRPVFFFPAAGNGFPSCCRPLMTTRATKQMRLGVNYSKNCDAGKRRRKWPSSTSRRLNFGVFCEVEN